MIERISNREFTKPKEECGVFGVYTSSKELQKNISSLVLNGLHENQHRGEESSGIVVASKDSFSIPFKKMGLVKELYSSFIEKEKNIDPQYFGSMAIGHNRYSTTGSSNIENAAPFISSSNLGQIALAHNGNITNAEALKKELIKTGFRPKSTTDSEILTALIASSEGNNWMSKIHNALIKAEGSFSLVMCTRDGLYAARDAIGNRPLSFGSIIHNDEILYAVSSETPGLEKLGIKKILSVMPGEIIKFGPGQTIEYSAFKKCEKTALCGLEIAYLMRPDSRINNVQLEYIRQNLGKKLAETYPPNDDIDFVTYIPESSRSSAVGYAESLSEIVGKKIPMKNTMLKNRYGALEGSIRGFINPNQETRGIVSKKSYHLFDDLIGANIVLIDDSIIRGKTTEGVIKTLKEKGVGKIHLRIIFPPVISGCPLGIDINHNDYLIAKHYKDTQSIAQKLGVESLEYLSIDDYQTSINKSLKTSFDLCMGCVTNKYPVENFSNCKTIFESVSSS